MSADVLEGKVGRMYMPKQDVASIALRKMKVRFRALAIAYFLLLFLNEGDRLRAFVGPGMASAVVTAHIMCVCP